MSSIRSTIKKLLYNIANTIRLAPIILNDYFTSMKIFITNENYVGIYVGICNKTEVKTFFSDMVAGGYTGYSYIKLFELQNIVDEEDCAVDILNHEVLHQVIGKVAGREAQQKLDNIHKSFYICEVETEKWKYTINFIFSKKNHITIF